jgi:phage major head subunit gpT-like protein
MVTPVKPIETFGVSTQRALEMFRLDYNTSLASQPRVWAETLGDVLPGDSLKDTYPIALDVQKYRELAGQGAEAVDIKVKDISVVKRKFGTAATADKYRLKRGDHAYIRAWARKPASMARARVFHRNHTVATLLGTGTGAGTCALDGGAFFSATHPVNPNDPTIKSKGSATWSNYQASATPLNSVNLTAEKTAFKMTPGPDGEELGLEATHVLVPTCLDDVAYNLLSVQDLILSGILADDGDGTMGTVRNPHFNSGLTKLRAPELPGSDATADWYLLSATAFDLGLFPWVLAEDASEELIVWDETSDFCKNTDHVKVESRIMLEAAFLFPHAIRKIKGA